MSSFMQSRFSTRASSVVKNNNNADLFSQSFKKLYKDVCPLFTSRGSGLYFWKPIKGFSSQQGHVIPGEVML